jgi:hypothetical protein
MRLGEAKLEVVVADTTTLKVGRQRGQRPGDRGGVDGV